MFDTPDLLTPTMQCFTIIFVALGIIFLSGLVPAIWIIRKDAVPPMRKKLSLALAAASVGALGTVLLCIILAQLSISSQWEVSHGFDGSVCLETPIAAPYKMALIRLQNGDQYVELRRPERIPISRIEQYAIGDRYVTGKTNTGYFWFDLETGADRHLENQDAFLASLEPIGVRQPPTLLSADTLCITRDCAPCVR
jgi:hypothetical protein